MLRAVGRLFLFVALGLPVCLWSCPSLAEPTAVSAAEKETARELIATGREKRHAGQLREALADFEKAHAIMRVPTTAFEVGKTQAALGLLVEARATLLEAARHAPVAGEPDAFKRARRDAKQLSDSLAPRLATLTLTVRGIPAEREKETKVTVDGAEVALASVTGGLRVNPGPHDVSVAIADQKKGDHVEIDEGGSRKIDLVFDGIAPVTPAVADAPKGGEPKEAATRTSPFVYAGIITASVGVAVGGATGIAALRNARPGGV